MPNERTPALTAYLGGLSEATFATSVLGQVEVYRGLMQQCADDNQIRRSDEVLARIDRVPVSPDVLATARVIPGRSLRTLDAVHVASAVEAGASEVVTYDKVMVRSAVAMGLHVVHPGLELR